MKLVASSQPDCGMHQIAMLGDASAASDFVEAAGKYLQLLGHHMGIEEGVLFELADKVVSDEDDEAMAVGAGGGCQQL